jgi:hypothetical protein
MARRDASVGPQQNARFGIKLCSWDNDSDTGGWDGPSALLIGLNGETWAVGPGWYGFGPLALGGRNVGRFGLVDGGAMAFGERGGRLSRSGGMMGRAFSPSDWVEWGNLGRWPRLVWIRAVGPRRAGRNVGTFGLVDGGPMAFGERGGTFSCPGGMMGRAFSPSDRIECGYLGRWPRLVWIRAVGPRGAERCQFGLVDGGAMGPGN